MTKKLHYPSYDVMKLREHWDPHTRGIVTARLIREHNYRFLNYKEAEVLRAACSQLTDDSRGEIIQYVLCHIDEKLHQRTGEAQRKLGVAKEADLIRIGTAAIDHWSMMHYALPYHQLDPNHQLLCMTEVSNGRLEPWKAQQDVKQKDFFQKLLTLTVEAYYSHPTIWSEIGYGGPAYPRGYIRTGIGQTDPWEAKKET